MCNLFLIGSLSIVYDMRMDLLKWTCADLSSPTDRPSRTDRLRPGVKPAAIQAFDIIK